MRVIVSVGGRFHAFNLAKELEKRDYLTRLITSYPKFEVVKWGIPREKVDSVLIKEILERGFRRLPAAAKKLFNPQSAISNLYDKSASRRLVPADIFVGWSSFSLCSLRKARKMGMVTVLDHGSSHIEHQDRILREEYEKFGVKAELAHPAIIQKEKLEYEEADYIATPSLYVKKTFLDKGISESKIIHVPYGVDLSDFKQIPKEDSIFRVVFAGGMNLRKGVHYLLQAFSELDLPNSELVLIGSKNPEIELFFKKYNIDYGMRRGASTQNKIKFIGHVPQKELHKYYSQGSVFVLMSIEEGLAMVQLQAMACGLPVICTEGTGGEDIVREEKDGFVIPIRDVVKLKERLLYLYENPSIRNIMGQSAKERASSSFTWGAYGNKMVMEYQRILAKQYR